jgi:hypothetical protein
MMEDQRRRMEDLKMSDVEDLQSLKIKWRRRPCLPGAPTSQRSYIIRRARTSYFFPLVGNGVSSDNINRPGSVKYRFVKTNHDLRMTRELLLKTYSVGVPNTSKKDSEHSGSCSVGVVL